MFFTPLVPKAIQYSYRWDSRAAWCSGLYMGMTVPFFGVIARRDLHASALEISLLISAPFLGHLLSMFIAWHMQNKPKKPYFYWLGMLARIPLLLMFIATSTPVFILLVIASQIIGCFTSPAYASMMKDAYPDAYRGRMMGLVRVGQTAMAMLSGKIIGRLMENGLPMIWVLLIGLALAVVLLHELRNPLVTRILISIGVLALAYFSAPILGHEVSYRFVFPAGALVGALGVWMFNHIREAETKTLDKPFNMFEGLSTIFRDRNFGLYSLAFFIFGFGNLLQNPLIPLFQVDELHITNDWVGTLAMVTAGTSAVFYAIWGRMMDRKGPLLTVILSFAIWGLSPLVYAHAHTIPTLLIASVIVGIASPGLDLTWLNAVLDFTDRENIPRYTALHTFLVGIRGLIAPFFGAWLLTQLNIRQCFYVSAGIIWLGAALMAIVVWCIILPAQRKRGMRKHSVPA